MNTSTPFLHFQISISNPQINLTFKCSSFKPKTLISSPTSNSPKSFPKLTTIPARDRAIDFGKHKGKMLGTLPSSYLKWVSNNLRARDFEQWAKLSDEVLQDPVYQDRIEWEFAQNFLDGSNSNSSSLRNSGVVSGLLEISNRFGWDNDDKIGWSRVDFELLGTSKSGRIPRIGENGGEKEEEDREVAKGDGDGDGDGKKRKERRERMKTRLRKEKLGKLGIMGKSRGSLGNSQSEEDEVGVRFRRKEEMVENCNSRFPGRESLLKRALDRKRSL
ncbi:hypothetical protein UlMin_003694 [Ulmus minor]